jgi:hypothetical protein
MQKKQHQSKKQNRKPKLLECVRVSEFDIARRIALLTNIRQGYGKAVQVGLDIKYTVGTEFHGLVEYTIVNAKIHGYETQNMENFGRI